MQTARTAPLPLRARLPRPSRLLLLPALVLLGLTIWALRWQAGPPIVEYALPDRASTPAAIAVGPDGAAWFTTGSGDSIGVVRDGRAAPIVRDGTSIISTGIAVDAAGTVWYTDDQRRSINAIGPDGSRARFQLPSGVSRFGALIADPAGGVWFTESIANAVILLRDGRFEPHPLPTDDAEPAGLAWAPDGSLWFAERKAGKLGRLGVDGQLTEIEIPTPNSQPGSVAVDASGAVWFTEVRVNKIGRLADGRFAEFAVPTERSGLAGLVVAGGAVWFAETRGARLGRLRDGTILEVSLPSHDGRPFGLAVGPDGAIWYTDIAGRIGRLPPDLGRSR